MEKIFSEIKIINSIDEAKDKLFSLCPKDDDIVKALDFSISAHDGQSRKSGEPYVVHPILVASIVAYFGSDKNMIMAALLHDVVEDTEFTIDYVTEHFGKTVAHYVEGLTKITEIRASELTSSDLDEKIITSALSFRKMLIHSVEDYRVIIIKLCDRLHNLLTLDALKPNKQKRISEETLVVYAPMAHRLGMSVLKNELEDLSFQYVFPDEYKKIYEYVNSQQQAMHLQLNSFIQKIKSNLKNEGYSEDDYKIYSRVKHSYSIYMKMQRKGISIDEVLDLLAIRVLAKTSVDCYKILGLIHLHFKPLISRFKDYIALPKDNGYQTIHTSVFDGLNVYEVQIRTFDMHDTAENGVAAHWQYKSSDTAKPNLDWFKNLEYKNSNITEFYDNIISDLSRETIEVYSPTNETFSLPRGAKAIDFAYAIHSNIGDHAIEAVIDDEKKPLLTELKNGDHIRIVTSSEEQLHCSWINMVKTSRARSHISENCRKRIKMMDKEVSYNLLSTIFDKSKYKIITEIEKFKDLDSKIFKCASDLDFLKDVKGKIKNSLKEDSNIFARLKVERLKLKPFKFDNIYIYSNKGVSNTLFDHCCHPKFGDQIVAFRTKNRAEIHHKLCKKAYDMMSNGKPMLFVEWDKEKPQSYKMIVSLEDKKGSLALFLDYLMKLDVNVKSISLGDKDRINDMKFKDYCHMEVESKKLSQDELKIAIDKKFKLIDFISTKDAYKE
jgi:GTP pyrophosphokinase/guanosine-3',5'-bis(diphosphate) 3'-pyrophosphohydrolase